MIILRNKIFSDDREKVPDDIMEKVERTGVVQQDREGKWRIVNKRKKVFWKQVYSSKENGLQALKAYHSSKH